MATPKAKPQGEAKDAAMQRLQHGLDGCEQLAGAVREVGAALERAVRGPLTLDALAVLVQWNMPASRRIGVGTVREVLEAAAGLGKAALR